MREAGAQHANERERELLAEADHFLVVGFNEFAAKLRMLAGGKRANRANASAGVIARVNHGDRGAGNGKFMRRR